MKWFGASWGAPCCDPADHIATPVGRACLRCEKPIAEADQGVSIPHVRGPLFAPLTVTEEPQHLDCWLDSIRPCPGCHHCQPEKYGQ